MRAFLLLLALGWACGDDAAPVDGGAADAVDASFPDAAADVGEADATMDAAASQPLAGAMSVSVGQSHACARLPDGVWCWGGNNAGQLGDGSFESRALPQLVTDLGAVSQLDLGGYHSCALMEDGGRSCWGFNLWGQVARGSTDLPRPAEPLVDRLYVSGGELHSCEVTLQNRARCFGDNSFGQLGDGTTESTSRGVRVRGIIDATAIFAGDAFSCVLREGGIVACFGLNGLGQLGVGDEFSRLEPTPVIGLSEVAQLSLGSAHACAVGADGMVSCWGTNRRGQLGVAMSRTSTPVILDGLSDIAEVATGVSHTCARSVAGSVWCWGRGREGQLGDGLMEARASLPVALDIHDATSLAAGGNSSCVVRGESGEVWCWGANTHGQLGSSDLEPQLVPVPVLVPVL